MQAYSAYLAKNLPVLWVPNPDYQVSAVKNTLQGVLQNPLAEKILAGEIRDGDTVHVTSSPLGLLIQAPQHEEDREAQRAAAAQ